ncbi:MAG: hypothetical protein U0X71_05265 [Sphingobacteriaceae bacterium]
MNHQIFLEKNIIDDFVGKMHKHWPSWNTTTPNTRLNDLTMAIKEICNKHQKSYHELITPKGGIGIGKTNHFDNRMSRIEVDTAINKSTITENEFVNILTSALEGLSNAELESYNTLIKTDPERIKLPSNYRVVTHQPESIAELVSDSCRKRGIVSINIVILGREGAAPRVITITGLGQTSNTRNIFLGGTPQIALPPELPKACFSKKDFNEESLKKTLSEWAKLRNQGMSMGIETSTWKHIVHMDHRVFLTNNPPDLLVNGRFPNTWKKISASLVSDKMPNWTYLYRRYPSDLFYGGGLRVGYILDVPPQNILSTSPEDVDSVRSEEHIYNCRLHSSDDCDIACFIKHNTPERLGKHNPKAIYALDNLLDPDAFLRETRNCPNRLHQEYHQNEMLIMCREGTKRTHVYENEAPIGDIKAKAIYLIIDDDDIMHYPAEVYRNINWAEKMAVKHNLPIFQVNRQTGVGTYRSPDKKAIDKSLIPHFNYLDDAKNSIIKDKLTKWDLIRKAKIDQNKPPTWQHIVHMDDRVLNSKKKPLLTDGKFPSDWKKISASLVTNETPDWTFSGLRVGYILDVPAQNILSTNEKNIFSFESEEHISQCKRKHKSGKCHVLCYVEANSKNRGKDLNAFESLLSPEELVRKQKMHNANSHNELVIMGPGTPNRVLYKGIPRTDEVKVKGIYLVVNKTDPQKDRDRNLKWAEKEAKRNAGKKDGSLPIFTVHV